MYFRRLEDLRVDHDYTIKHIAQYLGIHRDVYSRYESGTRSVPIDVLIKLADYYETSVDYLTGRSDDNSLPPKYVPTNERKYQ